jgi:uncharacterized membrane protein YdbT with pleckstrin-like domain
MTRPEPFESVVTEARPEAPPVTPPVASPVTAAAKLELLGGDEIIQLSIKPSFWFIPIVSMNVLATVALLMVLLGLANYWGIAAPSATWFQVLIVGAALRLGIGTLQWASRLYVLTNRRVLRFKGVLNVSVLECRLSRVRGIEVLTTWYGRLLRLGTIRIQSEDDPQGPPCLWREVARPDEIREILVKAVRKAQP